jgi:hypothetical protein
MRVQHIGLQPANELVDAGGGGAHFVQVNADARRRGQRARPRSRAQEAPAVDHLFVLGRAGTVARRGQRQRLPAPRKLLPQDFERAKAVAAVQRQRVIEHMKHSECHAMTGRAGSVARRRASGPAGESPSTLRRKASNISSDQITAL